MPKPPARLRKGAIIGIFGGGQLGKMLSEAAHTLGFKTHIYDAAPDTPAGRVADSSTCAAFDDLAAVEAFSKSCDVITYEFENIPVEAIDRAARLTPVYPDSKALRVAGDRLIEKTFIRDEAGVDVVPFYKIESEDDLRTAANALGYPVILKTRRFGYDGKGQIRLDDQHELKSGFAALGGTDLIAEGFAPFVREISVIAARGQDGKVEAFPITENVHKDHRLDTSTAPADDPRGVADKTLSAAEAILQALNYVGVMGIEFFEMEDGTLIVNEIAPRVHNSGHWTMDGGGASQFEQHIRTVTGLPLADPTPKHPVVMTNLIGDEIDIYRKNGAKAGEVFHDYDKRETRPGRKMGHVNKVG